MTGIVEPIRVKGLKELQQSLKALDGESQKQIRVVLNNVAETITMGAARRVPVRTGRARASVRSQSGQTAAKVMGGSKKVPYYGWLEFGGTVGHGRVAGAAKKKAVVAGATKRAWVTSGRYIYPAFAAGSGSIHKALETALHDLIVNVGLEATNG